MIAWTVALVVLLTVHVAMPAWWWVMVLPFSWGLTFARSMRHAFTGGAALGATAWGGGVALGWARGAGTAADRVASLLDPVTGSSAIALAAWTVAVGSIAAAIAAGAGRACRPVFRRPPAGRP